MPKFFKSLFGQVVLALLLGVAIGMVWPETAVKLKPLGDAFIKLIKMIIPVLVFCVVVHGIAGAGDLKRVGRVGVKSLIYFEVITTIALGLGLAYKSFALVAPAAAAWWLALVASESHLGWAAVLRHTLRVAFSAMLALGVFALWFVLDPDPQSVWREFIVGENAAKFADRAATCGLPWPSTAPGSGHSCWPMRSTPACSSSCCRAWPGWG